MLEIVSGRVRIAICVGAGVSAGERRILFEEAGEMRRPLVSVSLCMGLVLLFGWPRRRNEKADIFVREAIRLVEAAQEAEKTSYSEALKLYKDALAEVEKIQAEFPPSLSEAKIAEDEDKIGPFTITELKETVIPGAQMKAEAEGSPFACALLVAGKIQDAYNKVCSLTEIAVGYAGARQKDKASQLLSQAVEVAKTIEDTPAKAVALAEIATGYAKVGEMGESVQVSFQAVEATKRMEDVSRRAQVLLEIAGKYAEAGQRKETSDLLPQVLEVAETIEDTSARAQVLLGIAGRYVELRERDKASRVLGQAFEAAKRSGDARAQAGVLPGIASRYVETKEYDKALEVAKTIADPYQKAKVVAEAGVGYAAAGQEVSKEARKILHEMISELK